jgi:4-hydroxy-tetrahydrodipicolinate reductase
MQARRVAIAGSSGRMGKMLIEAVLNAPDLVLVAALVSEHNALIGQDAGLLLGKTTGVLMTSNIDEALAKADVLIDFTRPEATLVHLEYCQRHGVQLVIGTTGFDEAGKAAIYAASHQIGVVFAPNMSVGVNVMFKLLDVATRILNEGYDIEIIEAHHRNKVDSPSGTALGMGEVIAKALDRDLKACAVYGREGITGVRDASTIGFATVRGGDIIGDHTALYAGIGERIEITHKSSSRATYAQGSLRAVQFLTDKAQGLFDMQDVLGLK